MELTSVSLAFGGSELLATDVVTVDGTLIPVEPKASDDTGLWRPSMEMRLRDAVRTGRRLAVELVRNGKTELRSIDLAPLQAALAAVEASRWRCN